MKYVINILPKKDLKRLCVLNLFQVYNYINKKIYNGVDIMKNIYKRHYNKEGYIDYDNKNKKLIIKI